MKSEGEELFQLMTKDNDEATHKCRTCVIHISINHKALPRIW